MNTFEIQIKRLPKIVSEKDTFISSYRKQFEEVDVKLEKQHKEIADLKAKHKKIELNGNSYNKTAERPEN